MVICEQFYAHKFVSLDEINQFLERNPCKFTEEIYSLNRFAFIEILMTMIDDFLNQEDPVNSAK